MGRYLRYFLAAVVAGLAPQLVANPIDVNGVTITGPTDIVIPEDGVEHGPYIYTLTNNSGVTIALENLSASISTGLSGDLTDFANITNPAFFGCSAGQPLANGGSCTFGSFSLLPEDGSGETDKDFGGGTFSMSADFVAGSDDPTVTLNGTITITDPGFSRAPEPATLTLLGIGLAGLGFSRRRKRA